MKAFRFPLDRALQIRRTQMEIEQTQLQRINQELSKVTAAEISLQKFSVDTRRWIATNTPLESTTISTMNDFQRQAKTLVQRMNGEKIELTARNETQKQKVIEFQRRVKLLEKLRGKRHAEWEASLQKDQENFASDAFLARWTVQH